MSQPRDDRDDMDPDDMDPDDMDEAKPATEQDEGLGEEDHSTAPVDDR